MGVETMIVSYIELLELLLAVRVETPSELTHRSFELPIVYEYAADAVSRLVVEYRHRLSGVGYAGPSDPEHTNLYNRTVYEAIAVALGRWQVAPDLHLVERMEISNAMRTLLCGKTPISDNETFRWILQRVKMIDGTLSITEERHNRFGGCNGPGTLRLVMKRPWGGWSSAKWYIVLQPDATHPVLIEKA